MSDAIMNSQRLTDLRTRMLDNIKAGKPQTDGISADELRDAIAALRSNRHAQTSAGGKATKAAKPTKPAKAGAVDASALAAKLFPGIDLS